MPSFSGQTVLITGGARGIGLALCEAFLKEGANVAFCATSDESINKAKEYFPLPSPILTRSDSYTPLGNENVS